MEEAGTVLRWYAALSAIGSALVIASRPGAGWMAAAFTLFLSSSVAWVVAGFLDADRALLAQNVVLSGINLLGIYRWTHVRERRDGTG